MANAPRVTPADVARYVGRLGFEPAPIDGREVAESFNELDELIEPLEELAPTPAGRDREHWSPSDEEDPHGGYLQRCDVRERRDGPLADLDVAVKDNIALAGVPMTCGSPLLRDFVPPEDATVLARLLDAGARIVGKTNLNEFALGGGSMATYRFKPARNPERPAYQPGSSSGGSAVAVLEGSADVALGSDTGGSIRGPAAFTGIVGLKPTRGLVSHHGFGQFAKTLDNVGTLSRTVRPAARVLAAMAGPDPRDERTRGAAVEDYVNAVDGGQSGGGLDVTIGLPTQAFGRAPALDEVTREALAALEAAGAELREVTVPGLEYALPAWAVVARTEIAAYLRARATNRWLLSEHDPAMAETLGTAFDERGDELGEAVVKTLTAAEHLGAAHHERYYALAGRARERVADGVDDTLDEVDLLATTTMTRVAPTLEESYLEGLLDTIANTAPFNLTGHPALSVPAGELDGLPVGLQFVGPRFAEASLFRVASRWEQLRAEEEGNRPGQASK